LLRAADTIADKNITCLIYARAATDLAGMSDADCFSYLEKGFAIAEKHKSDYGKLALLQTRVYIRHLQQIPSQEKIQNLNELFVLMKSHDFKGGMANVIRDKASVFYSERQYDSSKHYINLALNHYFDYFSNNSILNLYNTLALIEGKKKNYTASIALYDKAIQLAKTVKDTAWIGIASGNKGMAYYHLGMYDSALVNLKIDIKYSLLGKEYGSSANAMLATGEIFETIYHNPDSARKYFTLAKETVAKGRRHEIVQLYHNLYNYYARKKDFENAFQYYTQYTAIKDSLNPLMAEQQLKEFQKQFELQKKEREIEMLAQQNEMRAKQTQQNRILVSGLIIFILLLSVTLYVIYRSREQDRIARLQISRQSEQLKKLNDIKDKIFSILSHDMRSPIAALKNTFDLLDAGLINEKEYGVMKEKISNQLSNLNIVLDNLLQWSKSQIQGDEAHIETTFGIREIVMRNMRLLELQAKNKNIRIEIAVDENLKVAADFNKTDIVVRNLLSNAIKFTHPGGIVHVDAKKNNGMIMLAFRDSGNGIRAEERDKIFEIKSASRQYGTAGESGTGLGLWLCKIYMEQNKGTIYFETESGKGSIFYISLPAANDVA
jgi:signal transduction histidine kinase